MTRGPAQIHLYSPACSPWTSITVWHVSFSRGAGLKGEADVLRVEPERAAMVEILFGHHPAHRIEVGRPPIVIGLHAPRRVKNL
jgi:hypothetical protein